MAGFGQNQIVKIRFATVGIFLIFAAWGFFYLQPASKIFGRETERQSKAQTSTIEFEIEKGNAKYRKFSHKTAAHRRSCSSCHKFPSRNWRRVRKKGEAIPDVTDYPSHSSCIGCHRQQFFRGARPAICSICHVNPGPRNRRRHAFPNPREIFDLTAKGKRSFSEFTINFPHDKHMELFGVNSPGGKNSDLRFIRAGFSKTTSESCATCHQTYRPQGDSDVEYLTRPPRKLGDQFWLKKGTFKTSPINHLQCFTCHSQETGIKPTQNSCATCHKIVPQKIKPDFSPRTARRMRVSDKIIISAWRKRNSSGKFRHEFSSHVDIDCASCHQTADLNTLDLKKKVPITSCNLCHITETSDDGGILNYEIDQRKKNAKFQCSKCHITYGRMPIPESHTKAISDAGGK